MKTRIASATALAAALTLGATGCGLFVPQATTYEYAPSDGIDVTLPGADVRNLLVITTDDSDAANIVFTGVNSGEQATRVSLTFVDDGTQLAQHSFQIVPGTTIFGEPGPDQVIVELADVMPGSTVTAYVESNGLEEEREVPVLDGTLAEYADLVPSELQS